MDTIGPEDVDLLVIGGGINGAGIARDAVGRGLSVCLVEQGDLAGATTADSSKLAHAELPHFDPYHFRLLRENQIERERLLRIAPHIVWPMRFVLPHRASLRPRWLLRLGLFVHDHLGGRELLPPTCSVDLTIPPHTGLLDARLTRGLEYSDCWVEGARLVALNALDAAERGAVIRTRTECVTLRRRSDRWDARLKGPMGAHTITARMVINAAGPWVETVLDRAFPARNASPLRLVKGNHLIVPRLWDTDQAYIFQNRDGRIVFAIPYEGDFTLLGTTDIPFEGDPASVAIDADEAAYICASVSEYLCTSITPDQAVHACARVRTLRDDRAAGHTTVTHDYMFDLDNGLDGTAPPILSVLGGKIITYRKLAEHALDRLGIPGPSWTAAAPLPGGDIPAIDFEGFVANEQASRPLLSPSLIHRLARAYGTRIGRVLGDAQSMADLGEHFGGGLTSAELIYLVMHEYARSADDVLWRRSNLGLHFDDRQRARVAQWFERLKLDDQAIAAAIQSARPR